MPNDHPGSDADWLSLCRRCSEAISRMLADHPTTAERAQPRGRGAGGDESVLIDIAAEDEVFAQLEQLTGVPPFTAISEERGRVSFGGEELLVVIDPIDGSLNAKRGLHPHALSIAVADGPAMGDVRFGYVYDFGSREEWHAVRGGGAFLDGAALGPAPPERRVRDGRLELVAIEAAAPRRIAAASEALIATTHRLRALGTLAVALCQLAPTRVDGLVSLRPCRAVDVAAAQLVVRESGGLVAFPACPQDAPLDLEARSPIVAARSPQALEELLKVSPSDT